MNGLLAEIVNVSGSDAMLVGAIIALANVVVRLAEAGLNTMRKRRDNGQPPILVPTSPSCRTCQTQVCSIHEIIGRVDASGMPLVYGSRELADRVYDTVTELRAVCKSNDRLVSSIDKLVERHQQGG